MTEQFSAPVLDAPSAEVPSHAAASKAVKAKTSKPAKPQDDWVTITLNGSDEVPPGGQLVGVNGRQFLIPAGRPVKVPRSVCEVLDNAVKSVPDLDDNKRIIRMRNVPRLSYTLHREA